MLATVQNPKKNLHFVTDYVFTLLKERSKLGCPSFVPESRSCERNSPPKLKGSECGSNENSQFESYVTNGGRE